MNFPENLLYSQEHTWLKVDGTKGTIGITEFAQSELGEIVFVEVETIGQTLAQGEVFGTVEAVKTVSDLYLPVDAKVEEFNSELEDAPELVNDDPYGKGWLIKVDLTNSSQFDNLLSPAEYEALIG